MIAEYKFRYDESYLVDSIKHYRLAHHSRHWMWILKLIGYLGLGALAVLGIYAKSIFLTVIMVFFILLLRFGSSIDNWWARRQFLKSRLYDCEALVRISEESYFGQDADGHGECHWRAFTYGYRFPTGVLLFSSPHVYHWLPDVAITSGSASAVNSLLSRKMPHYYGGEQNAPDGAPR